MGIKKFNPQNLGAEFCNTDMACKILCETKLTSRTTPKQMQNTAHIIKNAIKSGQIESVRFNQRMIALKTQSVIDFVGAYEHTDRRFRCCAEESTEVDVNIDAIFRKALSDEFTNHEARIVAKLNAMIIERLNEFESRIIDNIEEYFNS